LHYVYFSDEMISGSLIGDSTVLFLTLLVVAFVYFRRNSTYWQRKNVQYLDLRCREHTGIFLKQVYDLMKKKNLKHGGIHMKLSPVYVVADLDYVKNIMTRDFQYFPNRGLYYNEESDPLSAHIFNLSGEKWRNLRTMLNPIFTPNRMKKIFPILMDCETVLRKNVELQVGKEKPINVKNTVEGFVLDVIACCAFGLDCEELQSEDSTFKKFGKKIFTRSKSRRIKGILVESFPKLGQFLDVTLIPKDVSRFFTTLVRDTVRYREETNTVKNDFIQVLIDQKKRLVEDDNCDATLSVEAIAAQCFIFYLAGFSTSPTLMAFALYELAKHQQIQEKVRNEIETVLGNEEITYESIQDLVFMNQVVDGELPPEQERQLLFSFRNFEKVPTSSVPDEEMYQRL
jgi:cytochrome P450 family 6